MIGIHSSTGQRLTGIAHITQSIKDILTTPLGSRVLRRDYGSQLFELIDQPMNQPLVLQLFAATADALERWETRFKLSRVEIDSVQTDASHSVGYSLRLTGITTEENRAAALSIPLSTNPDQSSNPCAWEWLDGEALEWVEDGNVLLGNCYG